MMEIPAQGIVLVDVNDLRDLFIQVMENNKEDETLSLEQAAAILKTNKDTLVNDINNGSTIPYRKVGRIYKFSSKAIYRWLGVTKCITTGKV